jgi:hypothetical protein
MTDDATLAILKSIQKTRPDCPLERPTLFTSI